MSNAKTYRAKASFIANGEVKDPGDEFELEDLEAAHIVASGQAEEITAAEASPVETPQGPSGEDSGEAK